MKHLDVGFILIVIAINVSGSNLFLYCFFGQSANDIYLEIADSYFNAKWIQLSPKLQKYFIIMIANAQRPLYYDGFGVAYLELNTFLRVS